MRPETKIACMHRKTGYMQKRKTVSESNIKESLALLVGRTLTKMLKARSFLRGLWLGIWFGKLAFIANACNNKSKRKEVKAMNEPFGIKNNRRKLCSVIILDVIQGNF